MLKIKLALLFIFLVLVGVGLVFGSRSNNIRIEQIYVEGNTFVFKDDVLKVVRGVLDGNVWFLFPRDNILYYPRKAIEKKILDEYPEIERVGVSFRDFKSIEILVFERKEKALWCESPDGGDEKCYLLDGEGFIFKEAGGYFDSANIKFTGDILGSPIGSSVMSKDEFKKTIIFAGSLLKYGLALSEIFVRDDRVREGELTVSGKIIWNADQDLSLALLNLKSLVENENFKGKTKDGVVSVEYIDIQNSNKIFYKVR